VTTLADFGPACAFFMAAEPEMDPRAAEKWLNEPHVPALIAFLLDRIGSGNEAISHEECEAMVRDFAAAHGFEKLGPVVHPTRVMLTGKTAGPGLFELMSVLGRARMRARLHV
jgi:glutamyl-tRNA synthetase